MTREELKKEAESYIIGQRQHYTMGFDEVHRLVVGFADYVTKELKATYKKQRNKRIDELQKENAELKSRECWKSCEYANPKSELIAQHIKAVQQLTTAKELLGKLLVYLKCQVWIADKPIMQKDIAEAEQFLSEV